MELLKTKALSNVKVEAAAEKAVKCCGDVRCCGQIRCCGK